MFDEDEVAERIVDWFKHGMGRPFMLELRPTNRCNLNCPSCVARGHPHQIPSGRELSGTEYLRIIDEAAELGIKYVQISGGGEPFVRKETLLKIMARVKYHGLAGFVITNGTLFDSRTIQYVFDMKWDAFLFSVDAPYPELNDFLRSRKGSFEKAVSAMRGLAHLREQSGIHTPRLDIGPVLSHYNCHLVTELVRLGVDIGVDNVLFQPVHVPANEAGSPFLLTREDEQMIEEAIPEAEETAEQAGINTNLSHLDSTILRGGDDLRKVINAYSSNKIHPWLSISCFSPWFYIGIHPDGAVGPCSIIDDGEGIPNVRDYSLGELWMGHRFKAFRAGLFSGELPEKCKRCSGSNVMAINTIRERLEKVLSI